jgi:hypothetical protein
VGGVINHPDRAVVAVLCAVWGKGHKYEYVCHWEQSRAAQVSRITRWDAAQARLYVGNVLQDHCGLCGCTAVHMGQFGDLLPCEI